MRRTPHAIDRGGLAIAIRIQCPSPECGAVCTAADAASGRSVKCPKCGVAYLARPTFDGQQGDTARTPTSPNEDPFPKLPAEFGRYRVLRLLGRGGMGAVYLAEDSQLGRRVALKIPFFDSKSSPQRLERFAREARSAAGLHHPNICTVFDAGEVGGRPFLTMRYVEGTPLEAEIEREDGVSAARAAEVTRQVALALEFAHRAGIVHRDLKPANVMVAAGGEPVVMDFGLAKLVADADPNEAKLTRDGGVIGTPSYMSPEQIRGDAAAIGPASDIYSLGVMLFELLTGETPYRGSVGVVMGQALAAPVRSVWELQPDADPRLESACRKAMAKDPAARFASMAAFAAALDAYLKAPDAPPPPPAVTVTFDQMVSAPAPARPNPKRRRFAGVGLAVALVLAAAGVSAAVVLRLETKDGALLVEIDDPEVEARLKGGTLTLCGPDGKVRYTLTAGERDKKLPAGPYAIRVEGADGLAIDTPEFTLKRGGKVTVKVTLERPAVAGAAATGDALQAGSVWAGTRTFTSGLYKGKTLTYFLHIEKRDGAKFSGMVFHEGPATFPSAISGEVTGGKVTYTQTEGPGGRRPGYSVAGVLSGTTIRFDLTNEHLFGDGHGELTRTQPSVASVKAAAPSAGFSPLFNGKDLTGWVPHPRWPGTWAVEGGVLTGRPDGGPLGFPAQTYLRTARSDYTDFHLRVEARVKPGSKGGVLVRVGDGGEIYPSTTDRWIKGYDIDIEARNGEPTWTGGIMCGNYILSPPTPPTAKPGEWFVMDVVVSGWDITVKIDGRVVNTFTDKSSRSAAGFLSLQSFGASSAIEFRKVEIQELPGTPAGGPAATRAATVRGGSWSIDGTDLVQTSLTDSSLFFGNPDWTDYDFSYETRTDPAEGSALQGGSAMFRRQDSANYHAFVPGMYYGKWNEVNRTEGGKWVRDVTSKRSDYEVGKWHTVAIRVRGDQFRCSLDGEVLFDYRDARFPKGAVGLGVWKSVARWRNLRVTAPDGAVLFAGLPELKPADAPAAAAAAPAAPAPAATAPAADPDRKAAEYALSLGGVVRVNDEAREISAVAGLPKEAFRLTFAFADSSAADDKGFEAFRSCKNLAFLQFRCQNVGDVGFSNFASCTGLTNVELYHTQITSDGLASFAKAEGLKILILNDCKRIGDAGMAHFKGMKELMKLEFSGTQVTDAGLAYFKDCQRVKELRLEDTPMGDAGLTHFRGCVALEHLHLDGTKVTDAALATLKGFPKLADLRVSRTPMTAKGVAALRAALPGCKISGDGLAAPAAPAPKAAADPFPKNSVWVRDVPASTLTVTDRSGETFRARFVLGGAIERDVSGVVKDGKVKWLARDVKLVKGGPGGDNEGTLARDPTGDVLNFTYQQGTQSGTFTLRRVPPK